MFASSSWGCSSALTQILHVLGAALKLKLMENYKNGVGVDIDALESEDAGWYTRYVSQQKVCVCFPRCDSWFNVIVTFVSD